MFSSAIPNSSYKLLKKSCLYTKATPLISSTVASAVVLIFLKFAVMAIASFPRNSFLLKPGTVTCLPLTRDGNGIFGNLKELLYLCYTSVPPYSKPSNSASAFKTFYFKAYTIQNGLLYWDISIFTKGTLHKTILVWMAIDTEYLLNLFHCQDPISISVLSSNYNVNATIVDCMIQWFHGQFPRVHFCLWLKNIVELNSRYNFYPHHQGCFE